MASRRLDFLVFYRGNLATGFDYVYLKRHEGHAFLQIADKTQPVKNITDPDFYFYNPHFNAAGEPFNWRYREDWLDMTAQWDDIAETAWQYLETWMAAYRGPSYPDPSLNDEWGVRFKAPGAQERIIWGLNAFPANLQDFSDYLYQLAH